MGHLVGSDLPSHWLGAGFRLGPVSNVTRIDDSPDTEFDDGATSVVRSCSGKKIYETDGFDVTGRRNRRGRRFDVSP